MDNPQPSLLTFLDLPDSARRTVYSLAGLTRPCPIDLLAAHPRSARRPRGGSSRHCYPPCWHLRRPGLRQVSNLAPGEPSCSCPPLPLSLTLVSRRVRVEALDVLLGSNVFVARARAGRTEMLSPLASWIPKHHLARMRGVVVRLNCWPCPWGHDDTGTRPPRRAWPDRCCLCEAHVRDADPALLSSSPAGRDMLDVWELVCSRLGSSGLKSRQLDLTLICDVDPADDGCVASRLLDPMRCYLPLLRSCTLRLGRSPKHQNLARLARETALALVGVGAGTVGTSRDSKPFPFDRLPWEIKTRILQYTHLGPPDLAGYDPELERLDVVDGRVLRRPLRWFSWQDAIKCCDTCTSTLLECCCTSSYAAYSPTCTCRVLPTALFRVSHSVRRAAMEVFYPHADLHLRHHDLGALLDVLPAAAPPLLRRLTIVLTPAQCYFWRGRAPDFAHPGWHLDCILREEPGWLEEGEVWDKTIAAAAHRYRPDLRAALARLAAEANPSRLELELDLQAIHEFSDLYLGDNEPDEEDRFRWTYDLCVDVAEMICAELPGLRGVRFRLAVYRDLEPWLVREVLGKTFVGSVEPPRSRRRGLSEMVPSYHRMDRRIRGSHYHGDVRKNTSAPTQTLE